MLETRDVVWGSVALFLFVNPYFIHNNYLLFDVQFYLNKFYKKSNNNNYNDNNNNNNKGIKFEESELRRFYKYVVENEEKLKKRSYSGKVYYVFKKTSGTDYVNEINDVEYYDFITSKNDTIKNTNVLSTNNCMDLKELNEKREQKSNLYKLLGSKYTGDEGICTKNEAIKNAYICCNYEKYDDKTTYVALEFDVKEVLKWTFSD